MRWRKDSAEYELLKSLIDDGRLLRNGVLFKNAQAALDAGLKPGMKACVMVDGAERLVDYDVATKLITKR